MLSMPYLLRTAHIVLAGPHSRHLFYFLLIDGDVTQMVTTQSKAYPKPDPFTYVKARTLPESFGKITSLKD